jgi:Na+-transporting NADH:ubiquinone oxidoreductase subunit F
MTTAILTLPVADVRPATPRSRIVRIDARGTDFTFRAGQAVMVGVHGGERRRPYSIACAPEDLARDGAIELLVGVSSDGTPDGLEPGVDVDVSAPVGRFVFPDDTTARHFLFIGGGSGIAPLRSMIRHALARRAERPATPDIGLVYSARTSDEFAYGEEFERLASEGAISLMLTVTRAPDEAAWTGPRGRISLEHLRRMVPHDDTLCFVCGPPALVADTLALLNEVGMTADNVRIEQW